MLVTEPFSGTPTARLDFVKSQQQVIFGSQLSQSF